MNEALRFRDQLTTASQRLEAAVARARALRAPQDPTSREALLFNLERAAWAMIEMAQAWVFELRLGIPRKETEAFDLLQRHGWLELETARRYKQLSEFRNLSARESARIDWHYLGGDLSAELELLETWNRQALRWETPPA
jgi:uncharacterized protein YutE (UPF0331/DUF86 family)